MTYKMAHGIDTADRRRRRALRAITPLAALLVAALLVWQGATPHSAPRPTTPVTRGATGNLFLKNNGGGDGLQRHHRRALHRGQPQAGQHRVQVHHGAVRLVRLRAT